ncbi:MAG: amidohydrolase [Gemmatimonadota bacterium]|nr:amidohydrolase [Gemmatimonadota bacterium]
MSRWIPAAVAIALLCAPTGLGAQEAGGESRDLVSSAAVEDVIVLTGGQIWTGDPDQPEAHSLVIDKGRVVAVLDEPGETPAAPAGRVIDLGGRRVVPGFNDAHTHFFEGAFTLSKPNLLESDTPRAFVAKLKAYAETLPPGRWIDMAAAWDHERWPGHRLPSRALIDSVTPENPVWIRRPDGHIGLANSLALEAAGIDADTPDPPGGQIDRDPETGEPTGILRDAGGLVVRVIPETSEDEFRDALDAGLEHAARMGVTTIQDMCYDPGPVAMRLFQEYAAKGKLTARIYCRTALSEWKHPARAGVTAGFGSEFVRTGSLKAFADGALGSTTAWMFEPYEGEPDNRGLPSDLLQPPSKLLERIRPADAARLQLSIHAIGDAAISAVLDQLENVVESNPPWDRRFRIEHAQHMAEKDFARMAALGVIASVQPYHAIDDGRWAERKIGPERAKTTYAFRSFLDAGVPMAFGSDWPVAPLDPWPAIYGAVTRRTLEGAHDPDGWVPEQRISLEEALEAYTAGSARAEYAEAWKGRLTPGYVADLVVLDRDPFAIDPAELDGVESVLTMVGGRIVWARGEFAVSR